HVIEDLVDVNFGPNEPAPRLIFDAIGSQQDATAAALQVLVQAGILTPDVLVEQTVRQRMGLPSTPAAAPLSADPAATAVVAARKATASAAAGQGALW
ncbi:phage portal protein family protein, partial [Tsukamurella ocularis]